MNIEALIKNGQQLAVDFGIKIVAALTPVEFSHDPRPLLRRARRP